MKTNNPTHTYELGLTIPWTYIPALMEETRSIIKNNFDSITRTGVASFLDFKLNGINLNEHKLDALLMPTADNFDDYHTQALEETKKHAPFGTHTLLELKYAQQVNQHINAKSQKGNRVDLTFIIKQNMHDENFETYNFGITISSEGRLYSNIGSDLFNYFVKKRAEIENKEQQEIPVVLKYIK